MTPGRLDTKWRFIILGIPFKAVSLPCNGKAYTRRDSIFILRLDVEHINSQWESLYLQPVTCEEINNILVSLVRIIHMRQIC